MLAPQRAYFFLYEFNYANSEARNIIPRVRTAALWKMGSPPAANLSHGGIFILVRFLEIFSLFKSTFVIFITNEGKGIVLFISGLTPLPSGACFLCKRKYT